MENVMSMMMKGKRYGMAFILMERKRRSCLPQLL